MVSDRKEKLDITFVNELAKREPLELIARSETFYRDQVARIADDFADCLGKKRVILVAGPSSSGKTTTSLNLIARLHERGVRTLSVSLDDFFLEREMAPLLEDGSLDLETIDLVDVPCMDACFQRLFETGACDFPVFDFSVGKRSSEVHRLTFDDHTAVVVEGLHALNPVIAEREFCKNALKVYISIKTEYYLDEERVLSTRELRLIRRIIRDYHYRASSPLETLEMWKNVVRGEDAYIRPYRLTADYWVDSLHGYEPLLYRPLLSNLLDDPALLHSSSSGLAHKLRGAVGNFDELPLELVPDDSLLREFVVLPGKGSTALE